METAQGRARLPQDCSCIHSLQITLRRDRRRIVQLFDDDHRLDVSDVCSCDASASTNTLNVHDNRETFARASQASLERNG